MKLLRSNGLIMDAREIGPIDIRIQVTDATQPLPIIDEIMDDDKAREILQQYLKVEKDGRRIFVKDPSATGQPKYHPYGPFFGRTPNQPQAVPSTGSSDSGSGIASTDTGNPTKRTTSRRTRDTSRKTLK